MNRRGVSLIELLVVVAIIGILTIGITHAYSSGIDYDEKVRAGRAELASQRAFEDQVADLLKHASLSADSGATDSFFIGSIGNGTDALGSVTAQGSSLSQNQVGNQSGNADTIIFTATGLRPAAELINSDDDFETLNQNHGPQGGVAEIDLSMTPIGTPSKTEGLYLRQQRPADGDPTQGGYESSLNADVRSIQFEFFDGTQWQTSWDTRTMATKRLPSAVRVTYRLQGDNTDRIFLVTLPNSDVTPANPVTEATGQ